MRFACAHHILQMRAQFQALDPIYRYCASANIECMKTSPARRLLTLSSILVALAGCTALPPKASPPSGPVRVLDRYTTVPAPTDNIDSVATWRTPEGVDWLIATAKDVDNLVVFDAGTGEHLRRVGNSGSALGEFKRPNGIVVIDDLLLVVERDNHRVQIFELPAFKPIAVLGASELKLPYGLWVRKTGAEYEVYVTDSYQKDDGEPPPLADLINRVHLFQLIHAHGAIKARHVRGIGDTSEAGALRWVESIYGDPIHNRMLIAEEHLPTGTALRVYDMQGRYSGRDIGKELFKGQAEGIALFSCIDGSGYWLATDQHSSGNVFQVFDRQSLGSLGSFAGSGTQNTDGIHLRMQPSAAFPNGVFYAVHDDRAVSAFDWRDIAKGLGIRASCR